MPFQQINLIEAPITDAVDVNAYPAPYEQPYVQPDPTLVFGDIIEGVNFAEEGLPDDPTPPFWLQFSDN